MLEKIKSSYLKKIIFSMIIYKVKLKLVKYNKSLQNSLHTNIINYKLFSGKYIVYKTKTEGKEYNISNCELAYEGEYFNGERNGNGKEYDTKGKVIYEGGFRNGKRNGKGKEYDYKGKILFEGEYLNGKKWNGKIYYEDELILELKDGKGFMKEFHLEKLTIKDYNLYKPLIFRQSKKYDYANLKYEGEYLNGERNGQGKEYYLYNILKFEGEYLNGKRWKGKGYNLDNKVIYEIKDGNGYIFEYNNTGQLVFEGEYLNGEKNGLGGEFINEELVFKGEYKNGKRNGFGKEYNNGFIKFEGEYLNGKRHGKGKEYNFIGKLVFEGEYEYGWKRKGKTYAREKLEYEGEYLFDKKWSGKGYNAEGNIIYEINNGKGTIIEYNHADNLI